MRLSKTEILDRFRACCRELGKTPGLHLFSKVAGVPQADIEYYWPRFSALVHEGGATPQPWMTKIPDSELFEEYARVCLHLGKMPTTKELVIATRELKTRTSKVRARFGSIAEFDRQFRSWLEGQPDDFRRILDFQGWDRRSAPVKREKEPSPSPSHAHFFHPYLPSCLQDLDLLARGEIPAYEDSTQPVATLFERRCMDAFRCLGFEITPLGQGKGRKADCLAIAPRPRLALIVDAKVRRDGYVLGTEDRKFLEYAITHGRDLQGKGIDKIYLVIVASSFQKRDLKQLTAYLVDSPIRSVALVTARALMRIVEDSIRERHAFTLSQFDKVLFGNNIIDA